MTVDELEVLIEKEKNSISLVDARPRMDYRLGHLPGAVHAGWESFSREAPPTAKLIIQPILRTPGDIPHLLDTRSKKEFEGRLFWYQPRMGRMPRASLLAFDDVFGEEGKRFISAKTYKSLLPPGFEDARNRGSYCEVGVSACTISLLHEIYTGEILPVYDGSMMEWSLDPELPVHR